MPGFPLLLTPLKAWISLKQKPFEGLQIIDSNVRAMRLIIIAKTYHNSQKVPSQKVHNNSKKTKRYLPKRYIIIVKTLFNKKKKKKPKNPKNHRWTSQTPAAKWHSQHHYISGRAANGRGGRWDLGFVFSGCDVVWLLGYLLFIDFVVFVWLHFWT